MIFATVGSMLPFDRLVRALDVWAASRRVEDLLIQVGNGAYLPGHARWVRSLSPSEYKSAVAQCDLLVAHLGMGSVITGLEARKPMILLPRRRSLGEISTDHQLDAVPWVEGKSGIRVAADEQELVRGLDEFLSGAIKPFGESPAPQLQPQLIARIRDFIHGAVTQPGDGRRLRGMHRRDRSSHTGHPE